MSLFKWLEPFKKGHSFPISFYGKIRKAFLLGFGVNEKKVILLLKFFDLSGKTRKKLLLQENKSQVELETPQMLQLDIRAKTYSSSF